MTSLGNVQLPKESDSFVAVKVTREKGALCLDSYYSITDLTSGNLIGSLAFEIHESATKINNLTNYTHYNDGKKVHMGRIFHECMVAEFLKSKKKEILVFATGSQWYYLSIGFVPVSNSEFPNYWKFPKAFMIVNFVERNFPLEGEYLETYQLHKKFLAEIRGVKEDELTVDEVCRSKDYAEEMVLISRRAKELGKHIPMMNYPNMNMRMTPSGIERGKMRILSSSLQHDPKLVDDLQVELLENYAKQTLPEQAANLIAAYASPSIK